MWQYVGHSLCWCVWVPVRESLWLFWCETHIKGLSSRSPVRTEVDEGRKVTEKIKRVNWQRRPERRPRKEQKRTVNLWEQSREGEGHSQQTSAWLVVFVGISLEYTECSKSVTESLSLHLELTQVCVCSFVLFFHPLGCVLCVHKEMCNAPGRRWEEPLDDLIY